LQDVIAGKQYGHITVDLTQGDPCKELAISLFQERKAQAPTASPLATADPEKKFHSIDIASR